MSDLPDTPSTETPPPAVAPRVRLADTLSQDVTPQVDAAAKQMIAGGDALLVKNSRNAVHGFVLDQDHYDTRLEWTNTEFNAICSCEVRAAGFVCPHIWATVLLADRSGAFRSLEESHAHPLFNRGAEADVAGGRRSPNAWPARPGWKIHLASIAQASAERAAKAPNATPGLPRQVLYVVDAGETKASGGSAVIVELQSRNQKKSRFRATGSGGGWTKGTPFRLDPEEIDTFTDPADRDILSRVAGARAEETAVPEIANAPGGGGIKFCSLRGTVGIDLLRRMCETGRCRLRMPLLTPDGPETLQLLWDDGPAYDFVVRIAPHDDGKHYTLTGHLRREGKTLPVSAAHLFAEPAVGQQGLVFIENRASRIELSGGIQWMELFGARGPLHVPKNDATEFLRQVAALPTIPQFDLPEELQFEQVMGAPRPRLVLRKPSRAAFASRIDERIIGSVLFDYDSGPVEALAPNAGTYDPSIRKMVLRDKAAEARAMSVLKAVGFRKLPDPDTGELHHELQPRLLPSVVPTLIREGWIVEAEGKLYRAATDFRISVASGIDWFDLSGSVQFGDQVVPLPRLLSAARKGEHLIKLSDGTFGVLPEEWLAKYGILVQSGTAVKDEAGTEAIRFSRAQAGMLDVLLESQPHASVDATFQNLRNQLREFGGITAMDPPPGFIGQLRPYQQEGLGWFEFLRQFSFGGCLADDMGLGKTIQVLALLESRRQNKAGDGIAGASSANGKNGHAVNGSANGHRPSLVVAPRSLVFNWREEAAKFAPKLRILDHTGPSRQRNTDKFADVDVILTTYGTLRSDIVFLKDYKFDYAILDEAQAIKNAQTESAKSVRLLQANYRLALSGTPVQNHLGELWSLFEYLNPGMLGASAVFDARFQPAKPKPEAESKSEKTVEEATAEPEREGSEAVTQDSALSTQDSEESEEETPRALLSRALRPFILRRTKEQVAQDLPPCTEQTIYCELDEAQRAIYDELRDHYRQSLLGANGAAKGANPNRMQVLEALLRLRQAACHPGLIDKTRISEPSAKLDTLFTQLDEILEEGHKALVFSQFTSLLSIVRKRLDENPKGPTRYAYLDGKTRDRKSPVEQFQNDPDTKLFLISLKAGGLGLNLTGADYVFLLDPWWNPAVEAQAIDRAHRIGQVRHVFAYRLIAKGTVEEKVLQLQQTKRDLADAIISEDNAVLSNLTSDDLQILLS
ncbi:MAG TPA: SNF2-related protein [Phycisphaerae bacterium]|nr:SNF2-related protein [Phycisphaerae bacterium]